MIKKTAIILTTIITLFMIFSIFVFSSTLMPKQLNRFKKIPSDEIIMESSNFYNFDDSNTSVHHKVYLDSNISVHDGIYLDLNPITIQE